MKEGRCQICGNVLQKEGCIVCRDNEKNKLPSKESGRSAIPPDNFLRDAVNGLSNLATYAYLLSDKQQAFLKILLSIAQAKLNGELVEGASEEEILERLDFAYHNDKIPSKNSYDDLRLIAKALLGKVSKVGRV